MSSDKFRNLETMKLSLKTIGVNTSGWDEAHIVNEFDVWFLANVNAQIHTQESRELGINKTRLHHSKGRFR